MTTVGHCVAKGYRTIRWPLSEGEYERFVGESDFAKQRVAELHRGHPELFPEGLVHGYAFYGFTARSCKQPLCCRRLRLHASGEVFRVTPAWGMPYRSARVGEVEKALLLMRFHVPCWALA